uniref:Uncharacterized protein n=1 Tax=Arundo donax TaxID=35708 RepID=A0A0A9BFV4_ARUDO
MANDQNSSRLVHQKEREYSTPTDGMNNTTLTSIYRARVLPFLT